MKNILYKISIILLTLFVSCTEDVGFSSDTEALNGFSITNSEVSNYVLNSGTPDRTIELKWSEAVPGVSKKPTYKVLFFKADEDTQELISFPSNNEGILNSLTLTFAQLDDALKNAGYGAGATANLQWQVVATNGDVTVSTSKNNVSFVRFDANGIKDFNLIAPSNNLKIKADIYGDPNGETTFEWEAATTTSGSGTIEYTLLFDVLNGDFSDPLKSFPVTSGTSFTMTNTQIGMEFANNPNVKWTVNAKITDQTPELNAEPKFINWDVFVINELYLVGDHNGWDNATAVPFVNNGNGHFELRIDLIAGNNFKFLPTLGSWAGDWGEDPANPGKIIQNGEQNASVTADGTYVITVDYPTLSFTVKAFTAPDNLYMVGDHNGWNNATAKTFNNDGNGVFSLTYNFTAGNNFKFLQTLGTYDGDWGEDPANPGKIIQDGEQNIAVPNIGNYVVIVDFNTLTYKLSAIDNLYLVGDHNGWNKDTAPQFNTTGNGVFTIVQNFDAGNNFKFLPTLGTFDGDWGESTENAGKLVQDDEQNLAITTAGKYIVSVDFNLLKVDVKTLPDNLFLVGTPVAWNPADALAFTKVSEGIFELSLALTASDEFKFLPTSGTFDNDWGESKIYSGMLVQDDEDNIKSPGAGTFTVTVDYNKGTITVL